MNARYTRRRISLAVAAWMTVASTLSADVLQVPSKYATIQDAMTAAQPGDTVLVADGLYTGVGNTGLFFDGLGFSVRSENGPENCIIDGGGTALAFWFVQDEPPEAVIDGFTIRNCGASPGGAVFIHHMSDPTFRNCVFVDNTSSSGGAVFAENDSSPTFEDCAFVGNQATNGGAVFAWDDSSPTFRGCTFTGNTAVTDGGAVFLNTFGTTPRFESCAFVGNTAGADGGGLHVDAGLPVLFNVTFAGNTAVGNGGALAAHGTVLVTLRDAILWNDSAGGGDEIALLDHAILGGAQVGVSYSDVQGGRTGVLVQGDSLLQWGPGNIDADPQFFDLPGGDVRPRGDSPAIDAGDPATVVDPSRPWDLLGFGHARLDDGDFDDAEVVDMGAVEFGGLLGNGDVFAAIGTLELELWGRPGAMYGLFLGVPLTALDLGPKGTLFLDGGSLTLLLVGVLPPGGYASLFSAPVPDYLVGMQVSFQAAQKGPGAGDGLHLTNLEQSTFL